MPAVRRRRRCSRSCTISSSSRASADDPLPADERGGIPWRGAIGIALSVLLLWWALHNVEWSKVREDLRGANLGLVLLAVFLSNLMFPLRAIRWRPILDPIAPKLPYGKLWRATAIGMMANNILPARVGELVRAYVLSRETPVAFSAAFASLVVDRAFDAVVVLVLLVAAMFGPGFPTGKLIAGQPASNYAGSGVVLVVILAAGLYAIVFFPDRLIGIFEAFARKVAPSFEARGRRLLRSFADGLSVLRHPGRFVVVLFWAAVLWLDQALAFWVMFKALHIDVTYSTALFVQGLIVIGVALPSTPGYFGPFELGAVAGLGIYGIGDSLAIAWALTMHVLSLIPITVIGLYYVARGGMRLGELRRLRQ